MSTVLILYIEFWRQYSWLNWLIMFALVLFLFNLGITFAVSWKNWKQFLFFYFLEQFVFSETIWICLQSRRPWFDSWVRNITWRRDRLPVPGFMDFPGGSDGKESACNVETWVWSLGWEDPLEEGMATHSSILAWRIPMDWKAWQATVHGVTKSWTRLSD